MESYRYETNINKRIHKQVIVYFSWENHRRERVNSLDYHKNN
jgi:hypothetical protein